MRALRPPADGAGVDMAEAYDARPLGRPPASAIGPVPPRARAGAEVARRPRGAAVAPSARRRGRAVHVALYHRRPCPPPGARVPAAGPPGPRPRSSRAPARWWCGRTARARAIAGAGGWAALVVAPGAAEPVELSGGAPRTTNNRMEYTAALEGLRSLPAGSSV